MRPQSRRAILKLIAATPIAITFGFATSPLLRFLKPTTEPLNYFQPTDLPTAEGIVFKVSYFPEPWTCLPFRCPLKYVEFSPEREVTREVLGFIIRLPDGEIVAYSRDCPAGKGILNFWKDRSEQRICFGVDLPNPILVCCCGTCVFDLANAGRVVRGPAPRPPRQFLLQRSGDTIAVVGIEPGNIA